MEHFRKIESSSSVIYSRRHGNLIVFPGMCCKVGWLAINFRQRQRFCTSWIIYSNRRRVKRILFVTLLQSSGPVLSTQRLLHAIATFFCFCQTDKCWTLNWLAAGGGALKKINWVQCQPWAFIFNNIITFTETRNERKAYFFLRY